ncbi:hypothetical protein PFISCL1PPCAC_7520, partial [Pristionchus fissidentatus]
DDEKDNGRGGDDDGGFLTEFKPTGHLGQGTFGIVFEAEYPFDKQKYAIKRVQITEDKLSKALGEVYKMADVNHAGIVRYHHSWKEEPPSGWQVVHFDVEDTRIHRVQLLRPLWPSAFVIMVYYDNGVFIYIQMELCEYSLETWLAANMERRDASDMKDWLKELLAAVAYIHARKIFHRDLKPGNILFDGKGEPKICDVGIAAAFETNEEGKEKTKTRTQIGSPLYKAPEQMYKSKVDVFSLGLVFAEMSVPMTGNERE